MLSLKSFSKYLHIILLHFSQTYRYFLSCLRFVFSYCLLFSGTFVVWPYLALQMFTIGLSYNEIAIIMGAVQAISFVATPIAGLNYN